MFFIVEYNFRTWSEKVQTSNWAFFAKICYKVENNINVYKLIYELFIAKKY